MNISHDFPATLEVSDKNQWFQILGDFHRKLIIGRCYWLFSYVHSLQENLRKINVPTDLPLSSYQVIPRWQYQYPWFITTEVYWKVDFHCTMKLLVPLWFVNLHRALTEDDSPLAFLLLCPQWTSLKEEPWHNYSQFWLVQICTWIIRKWLISPYNNGA